MKAHPNLLLGTIFALVLLLAGATAFLAANRSQPDLALDTPEGLAQAYTIAVLEGDVNAVQGMLSPTSTCDVNDNSRVYLPTAQSASLRVGKVENLTDSADVTIVIDQSDGLYDSWSHQEIIHLDLVGGQWVVDDQSWPLHGCR